MKIIYLFLIVFLVGVQCQLITTGQCACTQLLNQRDCQQNNCLWINSQCFSNQNPQQHVGYCELQSANCASTNGCAWENGNCTFFTGCTVYIKGSTPACQAISTQCITDGARCVQLSTCSSYLNNISCLGDSQGGYCYWNVSECIQVATCAQLPQSMNSDYSCRKAMSSCTVSSTGSGCVTRQSTCDALSLKQCITNQSGVQCYWNGSQCLEQTCANAPGSYTTDNQCSIYNTSCTSNGNGCVIRGQCLDANIYGCVRNSSGQACVWSGGKCNDMACQFAPITYTTNAQCGQFMNGCITNGAGCVSNQGCQSALTEVGCDPNNCFWLNNTCLTKTCSNAPSTYNTYALCQAYMSSCTVNQKNDGCVQKTCSNAPPIMVTNAQCEAYFSNVQCITNGAGCDINSTCSAIQVQQACIVDFQNKPCYWNYGCFSLSCANAPLSLTTHAACQAFYNRCTNAPNGGCVDMTCTNITNRNICIKDYNSNACSWKNACYSRNCSNFIGTTHQQCNQYSSQCTVNSLGNACQYLTLTCDGYITQSQCQITQKGQQCAWFNSVCVNKSCSTAPSTVMTNADCNSYLSGCVLAAVGCQTLPTTCSLRTQDICTDQTCAWISNKCVSKQCSQMVQSSSALIYSDCKNYLSTCINNAAGSVCISLMQSCNLYTQQQCQDAYRYYNQSCYWTGTICAPNQCSLMPLTTHTACNAANSACTVNNLLNNCVSKGACSTYTTANQCYQDQLQIYNNCSFKQFACRNTQCSDADSSSTSAYISDSACNTFLPGCRTIAVSTGSGCIAITGACSTLVLTQCRIDVNGNQCVINDGSCWNLSSLQCSQIVAANVANCSSTKVQCKPDLVNVGKCKQKSCTDYTATTIAACQALDSTCTLNPSLNGCVTQQAQCNLYSQTECLQSKVSNCKWSSTRNICLDITDCSNLSGSQITYDNCWMIGCVINQAMNACVPVQKTCATATQAQCTMSLQGACYWTSNMCTLASSSTLCNQLTGPCTQLNIKCKGTGVCADKSCSDYSGTNAQCQVYNRSCSGTYPPGSCMDIASTCNGYTTQATCIQSAEVLCFYDTTHSTCVDATDCSKLSYTSHAACQGISTQCTVNQTYTGCQAILSDCPFYKVQSQCSYSVVGPCGWSNGACTRYRTCSNATVLNTYSHDTCNAYLSSCTVLPKAGCYQPTCLTAPQTIKTTADCRSYLLGCILAPSGQGCIQEPTTCQSLNYTQCTDNLSNCDPFASYNISFITINNLKCIWNHNSAKCQPVSCDNITPLSARTAIPVVNTCPAIPAIPAQVCSSLLNTCTSSANSCQQTICEDYLFTGDSFCSQAMAKCTTDGTKCVPRGTCLQALSVNGCVTDLNGNACFWTGSKCVLRSCFNAPTTFTTEYSCNVFLKGCTTNGAGCVQKSICATAAQSACTTDVNGVLCIWDYGLNACRNQSCIDYQGSTHQQCQQLSKDCTIGQNGRCTFRTTCENTLVQAACIVGSDGKQCLWFAGACHTYSSCSSIQYTTDSQCKQISSNCTSNGLTCIAISYCSELNRIGCVTGTEGDCMYTDKCQPFTKCQVAQYTTHALCQAASRNCTSDSKQCIPLAACSTYTVAASCFINAQRQDCVYSNGVCRSQQCSDFKLTTHQQCFQQLSSCTSDGQTCITIAKCATYMSQQACSTGMGSDGSCIWSNNTCRIGQCTDYIGFTQSYCNSQLTGCTSNGSTCISKTTCSNYLTQIGCNSNGTDGICIWNGTQCKLMTQCSDATTLAVCAQKPNQCIFYNGVCTQLNCSLMNANNCTSFQYWNNTISVCNYFNYKCQSALPSNLTFSNCNSVSNNTYTWNQTGSICQQCQVQVQNNNTQNQTGSIEIIAYILCAFSVLWII